MFISHYQQTAEFVRKEIENHLFSVGLLCRVFGRGKSEPSLAAKIENNPQKYAINKRLIQDAIGIRVVLYFPEDTQIVRKLLDARYECDKKSTTIDAPTDDTFSVSRYNLIYKIPDQYKDSVVRTIGNNPIDTTFEVQIRTVLSEGWHEVEHDLRYKCPDHWEGHQDLSRALNGVVATLETAEWTMRKLFDELAYRHYKLRNWSAMLHTKLRMKVAKPKISKELAATLDNDPSIAKELSRIKRLSVINALAQPGIKIPLTLDNLAYLWNFIALKNERLTSLAGPVLTDIFDQELSNITIHDI